MADPTVTSAQFVAPDPNTLGGPWALCVLVEGSGFVPRSYPLSASIGDVPVLAIVQTSIGDGFIGFCETMPVDGAVLWVGYETLISTDIVYHTGGVA